MADNMWLNMAFFIGPVVQKEFELTPVMLGLLTSLQYTGGVVGAYWWGYASDRWGRKTAFTLTLVFSALFGLASAFSPVFWTLILFQFLTGFGVGGNLPVDSAMFSEFVPKDMRGKLMSVMTIFWIFGSTFAAGLSWILIPRASCNLNTEYPCDPASNYGWRYCFGICGIATLLMLLSRWGIPESPRFYYKQGRMDEMVGVLKDICLINQVEYPEQLVQALINSPQEQSRSPPPISSNEKREGNNNNTNDRDDGDVSISKFKLAYQILVENGLVRVSILLIFIWMMVSLSYNSFNTFLPVFMKEKGIDNTNDLYRDIFIYSAAGIPGSLIGAYMVDSFFGRKWTFFVSLILSAGSMLLFLLTEQSTQLVIFTSLLQLSLQIVFCAEYTYTPEVYPTEIRTTMYGIINGTARLVAMLGPIMAGGLQSLSTTASMYFSFACLVFGALCSAGLNIETRGKNLQ
eukprot:TRINITY_DN4224_c0_g1_i1.p1 TRINITY_DN4224_c0_g1~~TRINITY_DN4224_c0_g1_i1.p1  ORF type:complete len:504 (+),score=42.06 TRINITY_DN4224_c0_g1_i1:134-1513(+)